MGIVNPADKTLDALMKLELPRRCNARSFRNDSVAPLLYYRPRKADFGNRAGTGPNMKNRWRMRALAILLTLGTSVTWGAGFWMPFSATPAAKGGSSGLYVIPSSAVGLAPAPKPTQITAAEPTLLGVAFTLVGTLTAPVSVTPALMIYAAKGADGNQHLYGLNLASTTLPKPVQITSLSVPATKAICAAGQFQSNLTVPTTLSVVIHVATPSNCAGDPTGTYYVAAYTASNTTAPTVVNIPGGTSTRSAIENDGAFIPLNTSTGPLGGILYWDSVAPGDENFYHPTKPLFTSPTVLLTGVKGTPLACVSPAPGEALSHLGGDYLAAVNTASGYKSYAFTPAGAADEFFAGQANNCLTDATHLYFIGTASGKTTANMYEEALSSLSAPLTLLPGVTSSATVQYSLIGSNTQVVVFDKSTTAGLSTSTTVETVPVGKASTSAKTIASYTGTVEAFLAAPSGEGAIDDLLFVSVSNETLSGTTLSVHYSSQVLSPSGASFLKPPANTVIQSFGVLTNELVGSVLEITGITDTNGGYGGATLEKLPVGSTGTTAITLTGGASYKVPANYVLSVAGFYGTPIAEGVLISLKGGLYMGVALNASKDVIVPISMTATNVLPML
jgi:hypothetical protein